MTPPSHRLLLFSIAGTHEPGRALTISLFRARRFFNTQRRSLLDIKEAREKGENADDEVRKKERKERIAVWATRHRYKPILIFSVIL